jgi:hypothetical protein
MVSRRQYLVGAAGQGRPAAVFHTRDIFLRSVS